MSQAPTPSKTPMTDVEDDRGDGLVRAHFARRLEIDRTRLIEMLYKHREEFCWHGNTGKNLSAGGYFELVDKIDALLKELS